MDDAFIKKLKAFAPIFKWLPDYTGDDLKYDIIAGFTVGIMLIPQGMAYAVLAGVNPIYGLYASVVPLVIYPIFGTSKHLSVGVVALGMLIVSAGVTNIAEPGSERYVQLVILLTILTGIVQVIMYVARLGFMDNLLSKPVIVGFTSAAAIIIGASQLGHLLGIELPHTQFIYTLAHSLIMQINEIHVLTLIIGLVSVGMMLGMRTWKARLPAALIIVVLSTVLVYFFGWREHGVQTVGKVPSGLPSPGLPTFSLEDFRRLISTIITLTLIQFMNVISLGRVFAQKHKYSIRPNQELLAVGMANLVGSLFQGLPVSGSFSRTAVNEQAGVRTSLSNFFAAVLIALTLLFFTPLFYYLPMPALAAIIIVAAFGLIDKDEIVFLFKTKRRDGYIALFTFFTTLILGIQEGILLGIGASLLIMLIRSSRPNVAVLGHLEGSRSFRDIARNPDARELEGILILRVSASFSFNNAEYFKDFILEKSEEVDRKIHSVIIDGMSINDLDTTAVEALRTVIESLEEMNIKIYFTGLKGPVRDVMRRSGLMKELGEDHFHMSPHRAVLHILKRLRSVDEGSEALEDYRDTTGG